MRSVFGLVLILGIALAGFAAYMAKNYVDGYQSQLAKERAIREKMVKTVDVIITKEQLRYGQTLESDHVRIVSWPIDAVPEGAFTSLDALFPPNGDGPRQVIRAMEKDEALLAAKVTEPGNEAGITSRLERGMRAFAIKVDVSTGVSGFLRPGDRVDVYWSGRVQNNEVTKLIEPGVKIVAIDQSADMDIERAVIARTVTVSARPEQVAGLAQAQSTGRLSLSLVGAEDDTVSQTVEVDQKRLLGLPDEAPVAETVMTAPQQQCTIRTRRGSEVVMIPIPCSN